MKKRFNTVFYQPLQGFLLVEVVRQQLQQLQEQNQGSILAHHKEAQEGCPLVQHQQPQGGYRLVQHLLLRRVDLTLVVTVLVDFSLVSLWQR